MSTFIISPYFSFRWVDNNIISPYNTLPLQSEVDDLSYAQPWQCGDADHQFDIAQIQVISDFVPTCGLYECDNTFVKNIPLIPIDPPILGVSFICYNGEVDFSDVDPGRYYCKITYNDAVIGSLSISEQLTEQTTPIFIDGAIQTRLDGVIVDDLFASGSHTVSATSGQAYQFIGYCQTTPIGTTHAQIIIQVIKDGVMIYQHATAAIVGASGSKSGILQPGSVYSANVFTEDSATVYPDIDIADNSPVGSDYDWRTSPLEVDTYHEGTQLFEATNTVNDKGVVFVKPDQTTLIINHRILSFMRSPLVKSDAEDYEDQYNTLTQESSIPFVTYSQYLGGPTLLPFWVIEKINLLYSLNKVKVDGQYFAKLANSEFTPTRAETRPQGAFWEVTIQPNDAYPSDQFVTGQPNEGDIVVVRKSWPLAPIPVRTANFVVSGVFNAFSTLDYIQVINTGLDTFILKLGTSAGDNDILETEIGTLPIDLISVSDIGKGFNSPTTIYCTIPTGVNIQVLFIYDQLDSAPINPPITNTAKQGTICYWEDRGVSIGTPFFSRDWDISTGLGQVGSLYEGAAMCDGRNNTVDRRKMFTYGWDYSDIALPRDLAIGAQQPGNLPSGNLLRSVEEIKPSLPATGIPMFSPDINPTNGDIVTTTNPVARSGSGGSNPLNYEMRKAVNTATLGLSGALGDGQDLNIQNDAIVTLQYVWL